MKKKKIDLFKDAEVIKSSQLTLVGGGRISGIIGNSNHSDHGDSNHHDDGDSKHHDNGDSKHHDNSL